MGMVRSIKRNIAKNLMSDMGGDKINRRMSRVIDPGHMPEKIAIAKMEKTTQGRAKLAAIRETNPQMWKRVLAGGDLAKKARQAHYVKKHERKLMRMQGMVTPMQHKMIVQDSRKVD